MKKVIEKFITIKKYSVIYVYAPLDIFRFAAIHKKQGLLVFMQNYVFFQRKSETVFLPLVFHSFIFLVCRRVFQVVSFFFVELNCLSSEKSASNI